ncbi:MAG: glucose-6-phosphate isomerase [Pseudomonadota bacterium]
MNSDIDAGVLCERIWRKDASLWSLDSSVQSAINNRLGWLDSPNWSAEIAAELQQWARSDEELSGCDTIVLLGMGGSSLAPRVLADVCASDLSKTLVVVDTTSPVAVSQFDQEALQKSFFVVSSKSGTTIETDSLYRFFYQKVAEIVEQPSRRFVAITDHNSWLHRHAEEKEFARVFVNPKDIGGRYSAISYFGLVPAAMAGIDVQSIADRANTFRAQCKLTDQDANPALALGLRIAAAWDTKTPNLYLKMDLGLASMGLWIEQLVAESTGKQGKGLLPIVCCSEDVIPSDRESSIFIDVLDPSSSVDGEICRDIGAEFFKWEFATAVAAALMKINPFDEPNVAEAKESTKEFLLQGKTLNTRTILTSDAYDVVVSAEIGQQSALEVFLSAGAKEHYLAVLAYVAESREIEMALNRLQVELVRKTDRAVTIGMGPRYLHSTGQLHKGGAPVGNYLQLIEQSHGNTPVPEMSYTFESLFQAQADGDFDVLAQRGRPLVRIVLKGDRLRAIDQLMNDIRGLQVDHGKTAKDSI